MFYFLFVYCLDDDVSFTPVVIPSPINNVDLAAQLLQQRWPGSAIYIYKAFQFDKSKGVFARVEIDKSISSTKGR